MVVGVEEDPHQVVLSRWWCINTHTFAVHRQTAGAAQAYFSFPESGGHGIEDHHDLQTAARFYELRERLYIEVITRLGG